MSIKSLPLIIGGAAALLLLSGKKNPKKGYATFDNFETYMHPDDTPYTAGPPDDSAGSLIWAARQSSLKIVASWGKCKCDPGDTDGAYGPKTKGAVSAFQACASIAVDGKWGAKTEAAMKAALATGPGWPDKGSGTKESGGSSIDKNQWLQAWPHMNLFPTPAKLLQFLHDYGYTLPGPALQPLDADTMAAVRAFQRDWNVARKYIAGGPPVVKLMHSTPPAELIIDGKLYNSTINAMAYVLSVWRPVYPSAYWFEFVNEAKDWASITG